MLKKQVKRKTTLPKISGRKKSAGRLKETELSAGGTAKHIIGASQAGFPRDSQCGSDVENRTESGLKATNSNLFVPVVDLENNPLMPTTCSRAKRWIKSRKATGFWKKGIYCVRLNAEPSSRKMQEIVVGIDPGSKREGYTVKSELHTYLNIQAEAVDWVKQNVETRKNLRRSRRNKTTPCRKNKSNRSSKCGKRIPPSTKARWQWKLRIFNWMRKIYPITHCVVEDIKARTMKNGRKWNLSFSPLEVGKVWFYGELKKITILSLKSGWDTKELRDTHGLKKNNHKLSETFETHCVDSWVLANSVIGGHTKPDNKTMLFVKPLRFFRRQLHVQNPQKYGIRKQYGGTMSMGLKRGSLVVHPKYGLTYVGGTSISKLKYKNKIFEYERISLHNLTDGKRLCQNANPSEIKFLAYNSFLTRTAIPPQSKERGFLA